MPSEPFERRSLVVVTAIESLLLFSGLLTGATTLQMGNFRRHQIGVDIDELAKARLNW